RLSHRTPPAFPYTTLFRSVQADPEGLLDQLAHGAQAAVAEVLVLVQVLEHGLAGQRRGLGRVVLDLGLGLLGHAQQPEAEIKDRSEEHTSELQSPYDLVCR